MEDGNVILVHNPVVWYKPFTWLYGIIRLVAGTEWNHCAMYCRIHGIPMVLEARADGVVATCHELWQVRSPDRRTRIIGTRAEPRRMVAWLGRDYDTRSLAWYCLRYALGGRWRGLTGEQAEKSLYCYEFAALALGLPDAWSILPRRFVAQAELLALHPPPAGSAGPAGRVQGPGVREAGPGVRDEISGNIT